MAHFHALAEPGPPLEPGVAVSLEFFAKRVLLSALSLNSTLTEEDLDTARKYFLVFDAIKSMYLHQNLSQLFLSAEAKSRLDENLTRATQLALFIGAVFLGPLEGRAVNYHIASEGFLTEVMHDQWKLQPGTHEVVIALKTQSFLAGGNLDELFKLDDEDDPLLLSIVAQRRQELLTTPCKMMLNKYKHDDFVYFLRNYLRQLTHTHFNMNTTLDIMLNDKIMIETKACHAVKSDTQYCSTTTTTSTIPNTSKGNRIEVEEVLKDDLRWLESNHPNCSQAILNRPSTLLQPQFDFPLESNPYLPTPTSTTVDDSTLSILPSVFNFDLSYGDPSLSPEEATKRRETALIRGLEHAQQMTLFIMNEIKRGRDGYTSFTYKLLSDNNSFNSNHTLIVNSVDDLSDCDTLVPTKRRRQKNKKQTSNTCSPSRMCSLTPVPWTTPTPIILSPPSPPPPLPPIPLLSLPSLSPLPITISPPITSLLMNENTISSPKSPSPRQLFPFQNLYLNSLSSVSTPFSLTVPSSHVLASENIDISGNRTLESQLSSCTGEIRSLNNGSKNYNILQNTLTDDTQLGKPRRIRVSWSIEEERALEEGMAEFKSSYATILQYYGVDGIRSQILANRDQVQLKDKARNIRTRRARTGQDLGPFIYATKYPVFTHPRRKQQSSLCSDHIDANVRIHGDLDCGLEDEGDGASNEDGLPFPLTMPSLSGSVESYESDSDATLSYAAQYLFPLLGATSIDDPSGYDGTRHCVDAAFQALQDTSSSADVRMRTCNSRRGHVPEVS